MRTDAKTIGPITLKPAGWIAGKVTDAATGKPVAGASVGAQFIERRRKMATDGWGQAVTDGEGKFVVGGLEAGVYNLILMGVPGRAHATARAVEGVRVKTGAGDGRGPRGDGGPPAARGRHRPRRWR